MLQIQPWVVESCGLYAIVRDDRCLPDVFLEELARTNRYHAERLARFIDMISRRPFVRPALLRPERPDLGVYAMYNLLEVSDVYNPSRLLCAFAGASNRIMLVGSGFMKTRTEPIQANVDAHREAIQLGRIARELSKRIEHGEIHSLGPMLIPNSREAFSF